MVEANAERLDDAVVYERDLNYDYFGFKTLERSYLLKTNGEIAERPQHMLMRVAVGIHGADIDRALKTYDLMSQGWFTHATPTLFNSGTPAPQMSSCFLLTMQDDSLDGIYDTLKQSAMISKSAGGIGLSVHNIRAKGSYIKGTNGTSNGLVPMLRVFNDTARYVDQGGGKRKGSIAIYLEPWHPDIFEFLDLRKNHGKEESRARDLFYALWTPDLFMQRVQDDGEWSLFCPNECPGLHDVHSEAFVELYNRYESEGRARRTVKARELWDAIVTSQIETGTPYMLYKDAANAKSNQQNLGTIRSSNLCTEIIEYTSEDEVAVCNLASIALPKFVDMDTGSFDHQALYEVVYHVTGNLNEVIDRNYYPVVEARNSNMRHRPVGLGVQGLADTFALLRMPFESEAAGVLNRDIFETIYFAHAPHRRISPSRRDPTPHSRAVQRARGSCNSTSGVSRNIPDVGIGTASRRRSSNMGCGTRCSSHRCQLHPQARSSGTTSASSPSHRTSICEGPCPGSSWCSTSTSCATSSLSGSGGRRSRIRSSSTRDPSRRSRSSRRTSGTCTRRLGRSSNDGSSRWPLIVDRTSTRACRSTST